MLNSFCSSLSLRKSVIASVILLSAVGTNSFADGLAEKNVVTNNKQSFYGRIGGYYTSPEKAKGSSFKGTPSYSGALGYHINDVLRTDIELRYGRLKIKNNRVSSTLDTSSRVDSYNLLLNAYVNLSDSEDSFIPYVVGGIGYGSNKLGSFHRVSGNGNSFLAQRGKRVQSINWAVGVGGVIKYNKAVGIDLGYKYMNLGKLKGTNIISSGGDQLSSDFNVKSLKSNEFYLGLHINF